MYSDTAIQPLQSFKVVESNFCEIFRKCLVKWRYTCNVTKRKNTFKFGTLS